MKKHCLLLLTSLILWACDDGNSTGGAIIVDEVETSSSEESSSSIESSSSKIRSSSSIATSNSSTEASNSSIEASNSSFTEPSSYSKESSSKKSSSSKSKSKSSSSGNSTPKSSSSSNSITSSSSVEHGNPVQTSSSSICISEVSPIHFLPLTVKPNADKSEFFFYGSADLGWPCIPENTYPEPYFTSVELNLAHVNELGQNEQARINIQYTPPTLPATVINFAEMGLKISDSAKTQCGNFKLFVVLMATNDPKMHDRFVSWDSVEFVREPRYCEAEPSSSAGGIEPEIELRKYAGYMETIANLGFSFKEDAEVPLAQAQIQVSNNKNGALTLHGVNGYKVAEYDNLKDRTSYDDDWNSRNLPPSPVYTTDFRFTEAKLADSVQNFDIDAFWVVIGPSFNEITGDDFYAVTLSKKDIADANGVRPLEIIYYKK